MADNANAAPSRAGDERWKNLATLPSTNFKMASGSALAWLTALVYLGMVVAGKDDKVNAALFDSWLIFVGSMIGLSVGQYIGKRMTYAAPSPDSERAGVPSEPAPSKPQESANVPAPETLLVAAPSAPAPAARQTAPIGAFPLPTRASD